MFFKLNHIAKSYPVKDHRLPVLTDVSLELKPGEFLGIAGPSGSGKTTLLNIMSLLDDVDSGELLFRDTDLAVLGRNDRSRFRLGNIGMVYQQFHLMTGLSVLENVMLPYWRRFGDRRGALARARELIERFGLPDRGNEPVYNLSGGEAQRIALARSLINAPPLLLADEPTGQLGGEQTAAIASLFREICDEGKTVVVVSHDETVLDRADRVLRLEGGKLCHD